jgi:hypothetical protein
MPVAGSKNPAGAAAKQSLGAAKGLSAPAKPSSTGGKKSMGFGPMPAAGMPKMTKQEPLAKPRLRKDGPATNSQGVSDFSAGWDKKTPTQQAIANAGQSAANAVSGAWSGIKNAASGMMKSGTANIHKSEVGHFVSAEEIYTKCQHCGQPEFVATPNGPRFNPCACFMAMTKDEDGNPTHFVALRKTADGYQVSFDPSVDEDAAKVFLLTLKTRLLVKKKFGV